MKFKVYLQSCSDFILLLNWGLNLLLNAVNRPTIVLHLSCSVCVQVSMNCRPFLPSHFFIIANCSVCWVLYNLKILFTTSLKFLSLLYLSSSSQLILCCFILLWVLLVWVWHFVLFLSWSQPWLVLLLLLLQPLSGLLLHGHSFFHLPLCEYVLFLFMSAYMMLIGHSNYMILGLLVMNVWYY